MNDRLRAQLDECVHCGFCLPACPTYQVTGREMESPRGRIHLIGALESGRIEATPAVLQHLDGCLDCRACETACPSGVRYGAIIETARERLEPTRSRSWRARLLRRATLRWILPHRAVLRLVMTGLALYQRSGAAALVRRSGLLPASWRRAEGMQPPASWRGYLATAPPRSNAEGERRGAARLCCLRVASWIKRCRRCITPRHGCWHRTASR